MCNSLSGELVPIPTLPELVITKSVPEAISAFVDIEKLLVEVTPEYQSSPVFL